MVSVFLLCIRPASQCAMCFTDSGSGVMSTIRVADARIFATFAATVGQGIDTESQCARISSSGMSSLRRNRFCNSCSVA